MLNISFSVHLVHFKLNCIVLTVQSNETVIRFLKPLHLSHEELQSSFSYLRFLELEWEIQLNRKQLRNQSAWGWPEYGTSAGVGGTLSKAFSIWRVKEVAVIGAVSLMLSSSSKCAFPNPSFQVLKLVYSVVTRVIPIAVNIYIGKSTHKLQTKTWRATYLDLAAVRLLFVSLFFLSRVLCILLCREGSPGEHPVQSSLLDQAFLQWTMSQSGWK